MVRLLIVVCIAAFDARRQAAADRLVAALLPQLDGEDTLHLHSDLNAKGSLGPWLQILSDLSITLDRGATQATHAVFLPDDAILVPDFVATLRNAIAARPEAILCCQSNHMDAPKAYEAGARWYSTIEGATFFGGVLPIAWVKEHLEWRKAHLNPATLVQGDEGINLWAMRTGRRIYKPLPSLVNHDLSMPSLDGNDHHIQVTPRSSLVWEDRSLLGIDWSQGECADLGCTYRSNVWRLVFDLLPESWDIEQMYRLALRRSALRSEPSLFIGYVGNFFHAEDMIDLVQGLSSRFIVRGRSLDDPEDLVHCFLRDGSHFLLLWWRDGIPWSEPAFQDTLALRGGPVLDSDYMLIARGDLVALLKQHHRALYDPGTHEPRWGLFCSRILPTRMGRNVKIPYVFQALAAKDAP